MNFQYNEFSQFVQFPGLRRQSDEQIHQNTDTFAPLVPTSVR